MVRHEAKPMMCDCQSGFFDCEARVRRFLRDAEKESGDGRAARNDLIMKITPLVKSAVSLKLRGNRWQQQQQADAVQETITKLCARRTLRTWLESPRRTWFCHWAVVAASRNAIDVYRGRSRSREVGATPGDLDGKPENPPPAAEVREQAERLCEGINTTLREFELGWQLVFYMRYSYMEPAISTIASAADISEESVFFRLRRMRQSIAERCIEFLSPDVSKIALTGTRHPVEGFDRLEKSDRDLVNGAINDLLLDKPFEEQLAFYMKYSPLAPTIDAIAAQLGEKSDTVFDWLDRIETQIKRLPLPEPD